jgi:hypothetical protein
MPHPTLATVALMAAAGLPALALCLRTAARLRSAAWLPWGSAVGVYLTTVAVKAWPGEIGSTRAVALRLGSAVAASLAAAGVVRRLPAGSITPELVLDMVPVVLAVAAGSNVGTGEGFSPDLDGTVSHLLYPVAYAALLLLASDLALRGPRRPIAADGVAALGLLALSAAAMWVAMGTTVSRDWILTVPDGLRLAAFLALAAAAVVAPRRSSRAAISPARRSSLVPALAVMSLCALALVGDGHETGLVVLLGIGFAAFLARLQRDRRGMARLVSELGVAHTRYQGLVERLPLIVYEDAVDDYSTNLFISPQTIEILGYTHPRSGASTSISGDPASRRPRAGAERHVGGLRRGARDRISGARQGRAHGLAARPLPAAARRTGPAGALPGLPRGHHRPQAGRDRDGRVAAAVPGDAGTGGNDRRHARPRRHHHLLQRSPASADRLASRTTARP